MSRPTPSPVRWWQRVVPDLSPLRESRSYRLIWIGQLISVTGTQLRHVAVAYHVYLLTESSLAVGMIGAFQAVPLIAFSLWGGVFADAVDRRRLLLVTQTGLMLASAAFAIGTQAGIAGVLFLYILTAVSSTFFAVDGPARQSLIPTLVERRQIPAAMALNQVMFQTSSIVGPALGGVIIARLGLAPTYWIDALSFGAGLLAVAMLRIPTRNPGGSPAGIKALIEGLRYLARNNILLSTMGLDFIAMFFGWPRALFPYFADKVFAVGPQGLGLLFAAAGVGALIAALTTGWVSHVRKQGIAVLVCVSIWGLAIAAFGMLRSGFVLALVLLAIAGGADVISAIFRGSIVQLSVHDRLRGRITSVNMMVVVSGPRLGEVESGVVASLFSPRISVVSGGLACLLGVIAIAALVPALVRYRSQVEAPEPSETLGQTPE